MGEALWSGVGWALGLDGEDSAMGQMALRAVVVYVAALAMVRAGEKRFLGKNTAFDVILAIMFGSVVSRTITGSSPFIPTLAAGMVLVGLHWLVAVITFRSDRWGDVFKGTTRVLIRDGQIQWEAMRKSNITEQDLVGALRAGAKIADPQAVEVAYLERSGDISAIPRQPPPQVIEVAVHEGVQTVRIEIQS